MPSSDHGRLAAGHEDAVEQLPAIFQHFADGVFLIRVSPGPELVYEAFNGQMEQWVGLSSEAVRGRRLGDLMPEPEASRLESVCRRCAETGTTQRLEEVPMAPRQGMAFQTTLIPVLDADGVVVRIVGVSRVVTEQPRAAHALVQSQEVWAKAFELEGGVRDITQTLDTERTKSDLESQVRQAQKLEALGTLAGGIAHDFNNILGAMVAFIDLIRLDVNDRMAVLSHVAELKSAAQRARDLVQQILTFSRTQKPTRSVTKLDYGVRDAIKLLRTSAPADVAIESQLDEQAPAVLADPSQVHQIVMNLGTNAVHAMRQRGGTLTIAVEACLVDEEQARRQPDLRPGRYARLSVTDTGHGMDEATLKRIFEPFFTTKRQGEGTGLGLAVVHGVVRDHDGAIHVESTPGRGTRVDVYVPEHLSDKATEVAPLPRGKGERILVVDDEEALCASLTQLLTRLGYQVVSKSRPQEALELYRQAPHDYALVLTDLTMPRMTGLELSQHVLEVNPKARVALMSGFSGTWTPASVRTLGLVDMLVKPLSAAALAEGVARALSETR